MFLRFTLLMISFLGYQSAYWCLMKKYSAFIPALTISFLGFFLFLGGIFRILSFAVWGAYYGGFALLVVSILFFLAGKHKFDASSFFLMALFVMTMYLLYYVFLKAGNTLFYYDDYSHWGVVIKLMTHTNAFPTAADTFIDFNTYPLGASTIIYYLCSILSSSIPRTMILGQAFCLMCMLFSLLAVSRTACETAISYVLLWLLLRYNVSPNSLQVDNLLGAAAMAALLYVLVNSEQIIHTPIELSLLIGFVANIKNSGLFLALIAVISALIVLYGDYLIKLDAYHSQEIESKLLHTQNLLPKPTRITRPLLLIISICCVYFALWKLHCYFTFTAKGVVSGKHTMSLSNYFSNILRVKSDEQWTKLRIIVPIMAGFRTNPAIPLLTAMGLLCLLSNILHLSTHKINTVACVFLLLFLIYEIGALFMYQFSMSAKEVTAQNGKDFRRYNGTVIVPLSALLYYAVLDMISSLKPGLLSQYPKWRQRLAKPVMTVLLSMPLLLFFYRNMTALRDQAWCEKNHPQLVWLEQMTEQVVFSDDDRVLILRDKKYSYPNFAEYYTMPCIQTKICSDTSSFDKEKNSGEYNVIINASAKTVTIAGKNVKIK